MRKENKLILGVFTLFSIMLLGLSAAYSFFSYNGNGIKSNTITTNGLSFTYKEGQTAFSLNNAMPMTDAQGKTQDNYFEFDIDAKSTTIAEIPYQIIVKRSGTGTNMDDIVKVYLTRVNGNTESPVLLSGGKYITNVGALPAYTNTDLNITASNNEKVLHDGVVPASNSDYTAKFRLRMWIDYDSEWLVQENGVDTYPYNNKTYTLNVNIYAKGDIPTAGIFDNNDNLVLSWNELKKTSSINGTVINELYNSAKYTQNAAKVVIPEGYTELGTNALASWPFLETVVLPSTLTKIGNSAFLSDSHLAKVIIPNGVTSIGDYAFEYTGQAYTGDDSIISIPNTVKTIGTDAFRSNFAKHIVFEEGSQLETIGERAFYMSHTESLLIPKGVTEIPDYAFEYSYIKNIEFEEGSQCENIGYYACYACSSLEKITIPASVVTIEESAFGSSTISSLTFEANSHLKTIDKSSFMYATNLTSVTIPGSVETIGNAAFSHCPLETINFETPSSLTTVEYCAFGNSNSILTLPNNLEYSCNEN